MKTSPNNPLTLRKHSIRTLNPERIARRPRRRHYGDGGRRWQVH